MAVVLATLF